MIEQTGKGKLSQQVIVQQERQDQKRSTRTERKQAQREKFIFEKEKEQAEELKEEKFKDKVVEEEYVVEVPNWEKLSKSDKRFYEKGNKNRRKGLLDLWRREGRTKKVTRTREKVIPFTLEDKGEEDYSYKDVYTIIPENLRKFFHTPEKVVEQKYERIGETKSQLQKEIELAKKKKEEEVRRLEKLEDRWYELARREDDPDREQRYRDYEQKYRDKTQERKTYWHEYIQGLEKGGGKLDEGTEIDLKNIINYADDLGTYEEDKRRAKHDASRDFYEKKREGELEEDFEKLGLNESATFSQYKTSARQYNKEIAHIKSLQAWGGKVGFDKLPEYAQEKITEFYGLPQGEVPTFDTKGKFSQIQSEIFGGTFSPEQYEEKVVEFQTKVEDAGGWDAYVSKEKEKQYQELIYDEEEEEKEKRKKRLDLSKFISAYDPFSYGTENIEKTSVLMEKGDIKETDLREGFKWVVGKAGELYGWSGDRIYGDKDFSFGYLTDPKDKTTFQDYLGLPVRFGYSEDVILEREKRREEGAKTSSDRWGGWRERLQDFGLGTTPERFGLEDFEKSPEMEIMEDQYKQTFLRSDIGREFYFSDFESDAEREKAFEVAGEEFAETEEARKIDKEYQDIYQKEFQTQWADYRKDLGFVRRWGTATGEVGLTLGEMGEGVIRKIDTPLNILTARVLLKTWVGVYKQIPVSVKTALSVGVTGSGVRRAIDPTLSDEERMSGFIMASVGAFSLIKAGIKFMKAPRLTRVPVLSKPTLKASQSIGKDVSFVKGSEQVANKVLYESQKLSQTGIAGQRTIVSQRWRDVFNRFIAPLDKRIAIERISGTGFKSVLRFSVKPSTTFAQPIYHGVPAWQPAQYIKVTDPIRKVSVLVKTKISGYEKAFKLLRAYSPKEVTDASIRASLRYSAPRVYEQWLKSGYWDVKYPKAEGKFVYELRQPKIDLGGGIKTRAGRTVQDVFRVQKELIEKDKLRYVLELREQKTFLLDQKGLRVGVKEFGGQKGMQLVSVSDTMKGYEVLKDPQIKSIIFKEGTYKELQSIARDQAGLYVSPMKAGGLRIRLTPTDPAQYGRTILFDKTVDVRGSSIIQKAKITKTPWSRTFAPDRVDETPTVTKLDSASRIHSQQIIQQLKGSLDISPQARITQVGKQIFRTPQMTTTGLDLGLMIQLGLKTRTQLKTDLKQDQGLKAMLKSQQLIKQANLLKQSTALKTALKTQTVTLTAPITPFSPALKTPTFKMPPITTTPTWKPPVLFPTEKKLKQRIKRFKMKDINLFGTMPDFTARALGLSPKEVGGVDDAMKEIRKIQTGFGIRRGARFKDSSPRQTKGMRFSSGNFQEKQLLRGIMI